MPIENTIGMAGPDKSMDLLNTVAKTADECLLHAAKVHQLLVGAKTLGQNPEYLPQAIYANAIAAITAANGKQEYQAVESFTRQVEALATIQGNDAALKACVDAYALSKDIKPYDVTEGGHDKIKHVTASETQRLLNKILNPDGRDYGVNGFSYKAAEKDPELYLHASTMLLDYNEKELEFFMRLTAVALFLFQVEKLAPIAFDAAPAKAKAAVDRCLEVVRDNMNELSTGFKMVDYVARMTAMQKQMTAPLVIASHPSEKQKGVEVVKSTGNKVTGFERK